MKTIGLLMCLAIVAAKTGAQEAAPLAEVPAGVYVLAEPVEREPPKYPRRAKNQLRQGWAFASFIITERGDVIEPMIEGSSHPDFDAPTLEAIESWRYKPATLDGKPVEQSMVEIVVRYRLTGVDSAGREFIEKYREISALIAARDFAGAAPLIEALDQGALNPYEDAWLGWLQYAYLEASGEADAEVLMRALRRALDSSEPDGDSYLQPDMLVLASQRLYALRARGGDLAGAMNVYERLEASKTAAQSTLYKQALAALEPVQREIVGVIAGPQVLRQSARIEDNRYWFRQLLRRSFALGEVKGGELSVVDVRCTRATRRLAAVSDSIFTIPDSWGDCRVYIKGEPGTTFAFEEHPRPLKTSAPLPVP